MFNAIFLQPALNPALIAAAAATLAGLAFAVWNRARRAVGARRAAAGLVLRLAFIAGLALVLLRPMTNASQPEPVQRPTFSLIVDASASMAAEDVGGLSRQAAVAKALKEARENLQQQLGMRAIVKCYSFAGELKPVSFDELSAPAPPEGDQTDIGGALMAAAQAGGPAQAGMLLISDGRVNQAMGSSGAVQAARFLSARKIPVWTATVGEEGKARDLDLTAQLKENFLFARQPGTLRVRIDQTGYQDWRTTVHIKREGVEVATRQIALGDGPSDLDFPISEQAPGMFAYEASVDALPREATPENNSRTVFVRATDRKTQVLLVEAEPYWDSKFMLRALGADANLAITALFQVKGQTTLAIRQGFSQQQSGADENPPPEATRIPRTRDELFQYDVVILGRGADRLWSADEMKIFKDYLTERGGNLIFSRGPASDQPSGELANLEPVAWSEGDLRDVRMELTDKGRQADLLAGKGGASADTVIRELPELISVSRVEKEKSLAVVLARTASGAPGDQMAVLAWQRYGKGKVLSVGSAGLWRWELGPPPSDQLQGIYDVFWRQLVEWMAAYSDFLPDQQVTFESNRSSYSLGDQVQLTVRTRQVDLKNFHPTLDVDDPASATIRLQLTPTPDDPSVFSAEFKPGRQGEFRATLGASVGEQRQSPVRFTVYEESTERRQTAANPGLMRRIAHEAGGETLALNQLGELPGRIVRMEALTKPRDKPIDAWDRPAFFYFLVGMIGLEWLIRRLSGLV